MQQCFSAARSCITGLHAWRCVHQSVIAPAERSHRPTAQRCCQGAGEPPSVSNLPCRQAGGQDIFSNSPNLGKAASAVQNTNDAETPESQQSKAGQPVSIALAEAWQSDAQWSISAVHAGDNAPSLSEKASAILTAVDPAAIDSQREDVQQPVYESAANTRQSYVQQYNSTLPAGESASVSLSYPMAQHVALPACRKDEECRADDTFRMLRATDCKMEAALHSIEVTFCPLWHADDHFGIPKASVLHCRHITV